MIFYAFLAIVALALVVGFLRSAMFKQLHRGNGTDAGQWGTPLDHLQERGTEPSSTYDGGGGTRESRRVSKHEKPRH